MTTVLVIEDDPDTAELLMATLTASGMTCSVEATGAGGTAAALRDRPELVLLDLDLPDGDGLDLLPALRAVAPVIVITGRREEDGMVTGFERGVDDWVMKPFSLRVLIARIEATLRRHRGETRGRVEAGPLVVDLDRRTATLGDAELDLTKLELDLLAYLADRPGIVVPRDELLHGVWQSSAEWQTSATVTEHVRRVRLKLGDPRWIDSVRGVGYRFNGAP